MCQFIFWSDGKKFKLLGRCVNHDVQSASLTFLRSKSMSHLVILYQFQNFVFAYISKQIQIKLNLFSRNIYITEMMFRAQFWTTPGKGHTVLFKSLYKVYNITKGDYNVYIYCPLPFWRKKWDIEIGSVRHTFVSGP
jgi:hypothetical protein